MLRLLAAAVMVTTVTGCATLFGSYDVAPSGLARGEERLRSMLAAGQAAAAWQQVAEDAPDDDVLRVLYEGVVAYHAGDFARSAAVLDSAGVMADARMTKSISRSALSLVSNDRVLPYEPSRTERLMIPYYAALARLRLGDAAGAAVEARRLSLLLQHQGDDSVDPSVAATFRYVAGALLEAAGDADAGDVAYRNAFAIDSTLPAPRSITADSGDVVIVLEQGFVAHRVEQGLAVLLLPEEVHALGGDDRATAATLVAARVLGHAANATRHVYGPYSRGTMYVPAPDHTPLPKPRRTRCDERSTRGARVVETTREVIRAGGDTLRTVSMREDAEGTERECVEEDDDSTLPYLLKVAWPVYRSDGRTAPARLVGASDSAQFVGSADLSRSVVADFERERALIVARTIVRGAAKLALTKGAERKLEEKHETAARIVGLLGNVGNTLLERADTRSWHLLPAGVSVVRVRLPAGAQALSIRVGSGATLRTVDLPAVTVAPGAVSVVPARAW